MTNLTTSVLDDATELSRRDPGDMLSEVATAGEQVRQALVSCEQARLGELGPVTPPRAVVVTGMGGSGIAGHVVQAAAGPDCPVPVERVRGWGLPAWVGEGDLVLAVSSSGRTSETLACTQTALDRGSSVVVVAAAGSPLAELAERSGVAWVPVPVGRPPRANLWALSVPLLVAAHNIGLVEVGVERLNAVADLLDDIARRCHPDQPTEVNPAKQLAAELAGRMPLIWGTSDLAGIAAYRLLCQLAENAKYPAVNGVLPEALHNQVVTFAAPNVSGLPIRLVLLHDSVEDERVAAAAVEAEALANESGVEVSALHAVGRHPLERMASLCAVGDFASVYLGLLNKIDPTPIAPIDALKARVSANRTS